MIINTEASIVYGTELNQDEYDLIIHNEQLVNQIKEKNMIIGPLFKKQKGRKTYYILGKELVNTESCITFSLELESRFTSEEYTLYENILRLCKKNCKPQLYLTSHIY